MERIWKTDLTVWSEIIHPANYHHPDQGTRVAKAQPSHPRALERNFEENFRRSAIGTRMHALYSRAAGHASCVNGNRKEVTRVRKFLKWLGRFRFKLKFEFEAGFNRDQDR